ncbi:MAG: alpha/beta hydrolase [Parasphingorhabdus sp.]
MADIKASRWTWLKRSIVVVIILLLLPLLFGLKWANTPEKFDPNAKDPGVAYINKRLSGAARFQQSSFKFEGQTLNYVEAGKGETILFLHGFPSYWFSLSHQMKALSSDYHVIAIDGLGAGSSDAPLDVNEYKLEKMAAHIAALLDSLGSEKVHIVGHDWGSAFAFGLAQRFPDRVLTVTGLSAPPMNAVIEALEEDDEARKIAAYVERLKGANPLLIVALGADKQVCTGAYEPLVEKKFISSEEGKLFCAATGNPRRIDAHINWYRANIPAPDEIAESDFWPSRTARITAPSLLIWGKDDRVFAPKYLAKIDGLSDNLKTLPLEGVDHWPHLEREQQVTQAIRNHIAGEEG